MRVHELAKELGLRSGEVLDAAKGAGVPVDHVSNALSDDEAEQLRAALAGSVAEPKAKPEVEGAPAPAPEVEAVPGAAGEPTRAYRLVGKATVSARGVIARRGDVVAGAWVAGLPVRQRGCFVAEGEEV